MRDDSAVVEISDIAASTAPLLERAEAVLVTLSRCLPSEGTWLALSDPSSITYSTVGSIGLDETMEALALLQRQGKIRHYGVSNLDRSDMEELWQTKSGPAVVTNQVLYNLMRRGIEWDLLPWLRKRRIPGVMRLRLVGCTA